MECQVGPLRAERTAGQPEKYTAPLVLLHGLWEEAEHWRLFSGYLAHRGWTCLSLRANRQSGTLAQRQADLQAAIAALESRPVLMGHDLGAWLALQAAESARAVVALTPLVPPPIGSPPQALQRAGTWWQRWRRIGVSSPRGRWRNAYAGGSELREPAALLRELAEAPCPPRSAPVPCLIVAAESDPITPIGAARALAEASAAQLRVVAGGHDPLHGDGWQERVALVHRWIVQELGESLLALYEEAINPE
jgi:pimeloyl-ACP methyl ester carboxylesterase